MLADGGITFVWVGGLLLLGFLGFFVMLIAILGRCVGFVFRVLVGQPRQGGAAGTPGEVRRSGCADTRVAGTLIRVTRGIVAGVEVPWDRRMTLTTMDERSRHRLFEDRFLQQLRARRRRCCGGHCRRTSSSSKLCRTGSTACGRR